MGREDKYKILENKKVKMIFYKVEGEYGESENIENKKNRNDILQN